MNDGESLENRKFHSSCQCRSISGNCVVKGMETRLQHVPLHEKCLAVLLNGFDAVPVKASDRYSFDFVMTRTTTMLLRNPSVNAISDCDAIFGLSKSICSHTGKEKRIFCGGIHVVITVYGNWFMVWHVLNY